MPLNFHKIPPLPTKFFSFYGQKPKHHQTKFKKGKLKVIVGTNKLKMRLLWLHTRKQDKKTLRISSSLQNLSKGKTGIQLQNTPPKFSFTIFFFFFWVWFSSFSRSVHKSTRSVSCSFAMMTSTRGRRWRRRRSGFHCSQWTVIFMKTFFLVHKNLPAPALHATKSPVPSAQYTHTYHLKDQNFIIK